MVMTGQGPQTGQWAGLRVGPGHCQRKSRGEELVRELAALEWERDRFTHQLSGQNAPMLIVNHISTFALHFLDQMLTMQGSLGDILHSSLFCPAAPRAA